MEIKLRKLINTYEMILSNMNHEFVTNVQSPTEKTKNWPVLLPKTTNIRMPANVPMN